MMKLENCVCPVCDSSKFKFKTTIVDQVTNIPGKFKLVQCSECNLVYLNPRPKLECINLLYPDNYQPFKMKLKFLIYLYKGRWLTTIFGFNNGAILPYYLE